MWLATVIHEIAMEMNITHFWKMSPYGVKRYHYKKLIGIREFLEKLAQNISNNHISPDTGTPAKNIPPLDEVDGGDTFSTCRALHFSSCIYLSAAASTISNITRYSDSSISMGSHNLAKREESREGGGI